MKKLLMLFVWFIKFGFVKPRDEYSMHDYIKASFCPEFMPADEFDGKEQLLRDTPGPAGVKYAYYVGNKVSGILGAVVAILALIVPVIAVALIIIFLYQPLMSIQVGNMFIMEKIFNGMHATALGLVLAHLYKIMYFNKVNRKSLVFMLPAGFIFIFLAEIVSVSNYIVMPFYILATIGFGILFGIIKNAAVKYREKHPKYIDPYSRKAKKMRDREIREDEEKLRSYIDSDDMMKILKREMDEKVNKRREEK